MKKILHFILISTLASCHIGGNTDPTDPRAWNRLDFGVFNVKAPPGWKKFQLQGIDSYVGGLSNGKDSLEFDYGWYSFELTGREPDSTHLFASDTIDGFSAIIAIPKKEGLAPVELSMDLSGPNKLAFSGIVKENRIALSILQSLRFDKGDSTRSAFRTIDQFTDSFPRTGKTLFQVYCQDCHSRTRILVAPTLTTELIKKKGNDWIYMFLTHRSPRQLDSGFHCPNFDNLPRADVDNIVNYLQDSPLKEGHEFVS
jgi:hypothetical protein